MTSVQDRTEAPEFDITFWPRSVDSMLARTTDPHHRAMLLNMRRHILLELSGRWREVLVPEFTVEVPRYRVVTPLGAVEPVGLEEVSSFYSSLFDARSGVWSPIEEQMLVHDRGVISEALLAAYMSGGALAEAGADVDPSLEYMVTFNQAYAFEFDENAKLIGERSYDANNQKLYPVRKEDVVTFEDAARILAPFLDNPPAL
ncbi:MAG TPA: hypothetical protein VHC18_20040 [Amycolatopsis sp.]|nr:hypothetical protein [Amycolatopsis sp.]